MGRIPTLYTESFFGTALPNWLTATSSGTGAGVTYETSSGDPGSDTGNVILSPGSTTTGACGIKTTTGFSAGANTNTLSCNMILGYFDGVSTVTDRFTVRMGFLDSITAEPSNGMYFRYVDNVNSGKWQFVTRAGGSETAVDTGLAGSSNFGIPFQILANKAGTACYWSVNNGALTQATANLPITNARPFAWGASVIKSTGTNAYTTHLGEVSLFW